MEVGPGELLVDGLQQDVVLLALIHPSLSPPSARRPSDGWRRLELGGVGETERRVINQAVQSDEAQGDGDDAAQAAPAVAEDGDVRDHAEQRLGRSEGEKQADKSEMSGI